MSAAPAPIAPLDDKSVALLLVIASRARRMRDSSPWIFGGSGPMCRGCGKIQSVGWDGVIYANHFEDCLYRLVSEYDLHAEKRDA